MPCDIITSHKTLHIDVTVIPAIFEFSTKATIDSSLNMGMNLVMAEVITHIDQNDVIISPQTI